MASSLIRGNSGRGLPMVPPAGASAIGSQAPRRPPRVRSMWGWRSIVVGAITLACISCDDATDPGTRARFVFRNPTTNDVVRLEITNAEGLSQAEALLGSGVGHWAIGTPRRGDGGFNGPWTWHLDPATVTFAEVTIEACQTAMSAIDDDLDYWISFGQVCIWGVVEGRAN